MAARTSGGNGLARMGDLQRGTRNTPRLRHTVGPDERDRGLCRVHHPRNPGSRMSSRADEIQPAERTVAIVNSEVGALEESWLERESGAQMGIEGLAKVIRRKDPLGHERPG